MRSRCIENWVEAFELREPCRAARSGHLDLFGVPDVRAVPVIDGCLAGLKGSGLRVNLGPSPIIFINRSVRR